jgi:hypothetical protein
MKRAMHENSLAAFEEITDERSDRANAIYELLANMARPMTDREIMKRLGFVERNAVAPRITELIEGHWLVEGGDITCPVTGKRVRRTYALSPGERQSAIATLRAKWEARHVVTAQPELFQFSA